MRSPDRRLPAIGLAGMLAFGSGAAYAQGAVAAQYRWLTFAVFAAIITLTMYVTYLAAKRVKSASDFYTAGGGVTGLQNGWAIAGDYLSAASFLGIAGLISQYGYDGFMYSVGWLVAYITVLLVIAEPCRNIGKYTLPDILAYRNNPKAMRIVGALSVITVSTFYLTAQMVGGGVLVKTLIGIDYEVSVIAVGGAPSGRSPAALRSWSNRPTVSPVNPPTLMIESYWAEILRSSVALLFESTGVGAQVSPESRRLFLRALTFDLVVLGSVFAFALALSLR